MHRITTTSDKRNLARFFDFYLCWYHKLLHKAVRYATYLYPPCNRVQEAKRRAGEWHMARLVRSRPVSRVPAQQCARAARLFCEGESFLFRVSMQNQGVLSLSSLDHSASTESILPCQIILASFNSLQSNASLEAKEKRQELLPTILDSWREYPANMLQSRRVWRCCTVLTTSTQILAVEMTTLDTVA